MLTSRFLTLSLAVVMLFGVRVPTSTAAPPLQTRQLLGKHCVECHNEDHSEGDLRLDQDNLWSQVSVLDRIASRIADGEMPPANAATPLPPAARVSLLKVLGERLTTLELDQLPGRSPKLTAREYSATLADVFGRPVEDLKDLPFDSEKDLKKTGEHQVLTGFAIRKYYDVAERYLDELIIHEPIATRTTTFTAANGKDLLGRRYTTREGALAGGGNEPIFVLRNPVKTVAQEGVYELVFQTKYFWVPPKQRIDLKRVDEYEPAMPLQPPALKYFLNAASEVLNPKEIYKGDRQVLCDMEKPIRIRLEKDLKFLSFRGPGNTFKTSPKKDPRQITIENSDLPKDEKTKALRALRSKMRNEAKERKSMFLLITGATFRGPIDRPEPEPHKRLFGEVKRESPFASCRPILSRLAPRLFRRPVSDEVLDKYVAVAKSEFQDSGNAYLAVKVALNAMLCSPHFLLKNEGQQRKLDDFAIASRLSYFLWNSAPDAELFRLAKDGRLRDPAVRVEQANRLLAERSWSGRFTANFTQQWLGLHRFGDYTPNEAYMQPAQFATLKPHLAREPVEFFSEVLLSNQSALNFIHSEFVVWNGPLYGQYASGVKAQRDRDVPTSEFQRMKLTSNPGQIRGGLATMPAIMSLTTDGENTQPILRGVWVARRLLGIEVEPPATVPAIEVNLENVSRPREILAKHKADTSCYACHVKFDYLGLAMENYDVLGRFKTKYVHPVLNEKNRFELIVKDPIDANSETPQGQAMPGISGVKSHLMRRKDEVMRNLIERLFEYALCREVRYTDRKQIESLLRSATKNEYRLRDILLELVQSESFGRR